MTSGKNNRAAWNVLKNSLFLNTSLSSQLLLNDEPTNFIAWMIFVFYYYFFKLDSFTLRNFNLVTNLILFHLLHLVTIPHHCPCHSFDHRLSLTRLLLPHRASSDPKKRAATRRRNFPASMLRLVPWYRARIAGCASLITNRVVTRWSASPTRNTVNKVSTAETYNWDDIIEIINTFLSVSLSGSQLEFCPFLIVKLKLDMLEEDTCKIYPWKRLVRDWLMVC